MKKILAYALDQIQVLGMFITWIVGFCLWLKGEAKIFTGVKLQNGQKITSRLFQKYVAMGNIPIVMSSKQGDIIFIHGNPNGQVICQQGSVDLDDLRIINMVQPGHYYIASCYNGMRHDINVNGRIFKRLASSIYPIHFPLMFGVVFCFSSSEDICKALGLPVADIKALPTK